MANATSNVNDKPICSVTLCGKEADWMVQLFSKIEYYCERHRPGVPETLMTKIKQEQ